MSWAGVIKDTFVLDRAEDSHAYLGALGLVPQELALYDELTVADNLAFFGKLYGLVDIISAFIILFNLNLPFVVEIILILILMFKGITSLL